MAFKGRRSESKNSDLSLTPQQWDERARNLVLNRLTRGPRTKKQLAQMLALKEVPEDISLSILDRFEEVHLIDDAAYARAFASDRRASRGLSKSALKRELNQAGVAAEFIDEALEPIQLEDEVLLAINLVRKRWRSVSSLPRDARQRRLAGYLGRRGFGGSIISAAISAVEQESASA
jgi:regulatory protein